MGARRQECRRYLFPCQRGGVEAVRRRRERKVSDELVGEMFDLSDQILDLKATDLTDVQRQVIIAKYAHETDCEVVGSCDGRLFASILAAPSSLNGEGCDA